MYNPKKVIATWTGHTEDDCPVCTSIKCWWEGRRSNTNLADRQRQTGKRLISVSHPADSSFCEQDTVLPSQGCFDCPICKKIVHKPIELKTCGSLVCADCLCQCLQESQTTSCPCCQSGHLDDLEAIQPPHFESHVQCVQETRVLKTPQGPP